MRTAVSNVLTTVRYCATVSIALTFTLILVYTCKLYAYINSCVNTAVSGLSCVCAPPCHNCKETTNSYTIAYRCKQHACGYGARS